MNSLDPRVKRLPEFESNQIKPKATLDQFGTYEVFVQPNAVKPFQHEGVVHAPNLEMAYVLSKETFTRRFTCTSLYVVDTRDVYVSPLTDGDKHVYDLFTTEDEPKDAAWAFEIYHLLKRGKQHIHAGSSKGSTPLNAILNFKPLSQGKIVYNVWAIRTKAIRFTTAEEQDLWNTLPEKKFRDASFYKGGDRLKDFLERSK